MTRACEFQVRLPHHKILLALACFEPFLTAPQLTRLLYSRGSIQSVRGWLSSLAKEGFIQGRYIPKRTREGHPLTGYRLDRKGRQYAERQGVQIAAYFRPSEWPQDPEFYWHSQLLNDILILFELLCRAVPQLELADQISERELRRAPMLVPSSDGTQTPVTFDHWLYLRGSPGGHWCLAIEADRGTERENNYRKRVRARVLAYPEAYRKRFETELLTIAYITDAGSRRLRAMLEWTEAELTALDARDMAELFCFIAIDPERTDPLPLFLSPCWYQPFSSQPAFVLERIDKQLGLA